MGMILSSHPLFCVVMGGCLEVVNGVRFGTVLGILWIEIVVYI